MKKEFLRISNGRKETEGLELLQDFYLNVYEQSVTLITGGSVLEMNCIADLLAGKQNFSSGEVEFCGERINRVGNMQFLAEHIAMISDSNRLVNTVSIVDNFFICSESRQPFFAQDGKNRKKLQELLDEFEVDIDLDRKAGSLDFVQQCQLQLLKQYYHGKQAVLWDKRKTSLSNEEFLELYELMSRLKRRGMTFLVLDYILYPCWSYLDTLVVIRKAGTILHEDVALLSDWQKQTILEDLMNREARQRPVAVTYQRNTVFQLQDIYTEYLFQVNLKLHAGEIAAIYYENFEVAQDLLHIINGDKVAERGDVLICGRHSAARGRDQRVREGVSCVQTYGSSGYLFHNFSALDNYSLPKGLKFRGLWVFGSYQSHLKKVLNTMAGRNIALLPPEELTPKETLLVRFQAEILARPKALVCVNPFSSVDRGLRTDVAQLIDQIAKQGTAVILLTRFEDIRSSDRYTQYELTEEGTLELAYLDDL